MAEKFDPPVEVDLGSNPQRVVFNTVEQADNWIQAELAAWGESLIDRDTLNPLPLLVKNVLNAQRTALNQIVAVVNDAKNANSDTCPPDDVVAKLQPFVAGTAIHSKSALGAHALSLIANADSIPARTSAVGFLAAAIQHPTTVQDLHHGQNHPAQIGTFIRGIAEYAALVSPDGKDVVRIFDDYMQDKTSAWEQQLATHQNDHFDAVEAIKDKRKQITDEHTRQETEFTELKDSYETQFSEFENFYKEGLRTKAPVRYWQLKSLRHTILGAFMTILFLTGSGAAAYYGFQLASDFNSAVASGSAMANEPTTEGAEPQQRDSDPASLIQLAFSKFLILVVPGFFAVWILRIVLKIALNNLAIADDARHRVSMVETFLSMMEHSDKLDEADRILMLQALFRPLPGSTDEDTGPPNWFDVMMQQVGKKK